jgi:hypothetical protein
MVTSRGSFFFGAIMFEGADELSLGQDTVFDGPDLRLKLVTRY